MPPLLGEKRHNGTENARADPRVENSQEDVRQEQQHQQRAGNGFHVREMHDAFVNDHL